MHLRHVRTFVAVADVGTVSKAAQQLHVAQPALSRQIASLEDELGLKRFDRVGRRLLLTSDGEQILGECRALLSHARAIAEQAQVLRRGEIGVLHVSASPHLIEGIFPEFLRHYAQRYPGVQVRLTDVARGPRRSRCSNAASSISCRRSCGRSTRRSGASQCIHSPR